MNHLQMILHHSHLRRRNHNYYFHNHPHLRNLHNPHFPPSSKINYQFISLLRLQYCFRAVLKCKRLYQWRVLKPNILTVGVSFQIHSFPFHSYSAFILVTRTRSIPDMRHNRCEEDNFILINQSKEFFYNNRKSRSCLWQINSCSVQINSILFYEIILLIQTSRHSLSVVQVRSLTNIIINYYVNRGGGSGINPGVLGHRGLRFIIHFVSHGSCSLYTTSCQNL